MKVNLIERSIFMGQVVQRRKKAMPKMTFKALYDTNFSDDLNIDLHKVDSYNLRSSEAPTIRVPTIENNTFHDLAVSVFKHLPAEVRNITLRKAFFIDWI